MTEVTPKDRESRLEIRMRPKGQPPLDRIVRVFLTRLLSPRRRRHDRFSSTALASENRICQSRLLIRDRAITNPQPLRWPAPYLAPRSEEGEEAATPGQPVAPCAFLEVSLRRFTLENHRLPLALPQSSGQVRNSHVSLNPLSARLLRLAIQKTSPLVQNLWTMCLPCGSSRKTKNKYFPRVPHFSRVLCARKPALSGAQGWEFSSGDVAHYPFNHKCNPSAPTNPAIPQK